MGHPWITLIHPPLLKPQPICPAAAHHAYISSKLDEQYAIFMKSVLKFIPQDSYITTNGTH